MRVCVVRVGGWDWRGKVGGWAGGACATTHAIAHPAPNSPTHLPACQAGCCWAGHSAAQQGPGRGGAAVQQVSVCVCARECVCAGAGLCGGGGLGGSCCLPPDAAPPPIHPPTPPTPPTTHKGARPRCASSRANGWWTSESTMRCVVQGGGAWATREVALPLVAPPPLISSPPPHTHTHSSRPPHHTPTPTHLAPPHTPRARLAAAAAEGGPAGAGVKGHLPAPRAVGQALCRAGAAAARAAGPRLGGGGVRDSRGGGGGAGGS